MPSSMDEKISAQKAAVRSQKGWVTRTRNKIEEELAKDDLDGEKITAYMQELEKRMDGYEKAVQTLDTFFEIVNSPEVDQFRVVEDSYMCEVVDLKIKVKQAIHDLNKEDAVNASVSGAEANKQVLVLESDNWSKSLSYNGNACD